MIELITDDNHLPVTFGNLECPNINEDTTNKNSFYVAVLIDWLIRLNKFEFL